MSRLAQRDKLIEKLRREHLKLDTKVSLLEGQKFLTAAEVAEVKRLKKLKLEEQGGLCPICSMKLPESYNVLDRLQAVDGYTPENTRLICNECDKKVQRERRYA